MNKETYREAIDEVRFSPDFQEQTLRKLEQYTGKEKHSMKAHPKFRKIAAVAAAAALILAIGVTAVATDGFRDLAQLIAPVFPGENVEALDLATIEKLGTIVGVSNTQSGVAVTLDSVIRDKYQVMAVFTVSGVKGKPLLFDFGALQIGDCVLEGASGSCSPHPTEKGSVLYTATWSNSGSEEIPEGDAVITFKNLTIHPHRSFLEKHIDGIWTLPFHSSYENLSQNLPAGQTVDLEEVRLTVDRLTVSPLSLMMEYTVEAGEHYEALADPESEEDRTLYERVSWPDITVTCKDGKLLGSSSHHWEEEGFESFDGGKADLHPENGVMKGWIQITFGTILPLEEIECITVEGVEIPVK